MLYRIAILLVLFVSPATVNGQELTLPKKDSFHLFLLVGQSNMAGRGQVEEVDCKVHPRVLVLNKETKWQPAIAPLHFDKPKIVGVGIGGTFGRLIAEADPEVTVGLIPCAVGGSPIDSWIPGGYHKSTKTHPYDDTRVRVKAVLNQGTLKGILWHQGESDSQDPLADRYQEKLHRLISRFRQEFAAPNTPFIAGQMGQFPERPWSEAKKKVDAAHQNLPNHIPHTAFVNSDRLSHKGDQVHFDSKSYRELGRRYAKAYGRLSQK